MQRPKQRRKTTAKTKAINQSLRPSGFAPAFGRAVAASRLAGRGAEAPLYLKGKSKKQKQNAGVLRCAQNDTGLDGVEENNGNGKCNGNGNGNCNGNGNGNEDKWAAWREQQQISPLRCSR